MSVLFDLFSSFFKIGAVAFGGGYAMIPLICGEVVNVRGWLDMAEFVDVIAISQGTPGPIAINSATYVGFKVAGVPGSAVATLGVVLPPFIIMMILGRLFLKYKEVPVVKDMLSGIRPVVVALILCAALSVFSTSVTGVVPAIVAAAAIVAILAFDVDPVLLLVISGAAGLVMYRS
ncbi:MAG: chromate transporter [Bacillota bacterium]|jgi:chromate transporter|nr:chromate transporter [Candidatus Fermentithermobacillaceae bacterium]